MKLQEFNGANPRQIHALAGQKIVSPEGDFTGGQLFKEDEPAGYYYDNESYFNFNHPEKKALAALQTKEDMFDTDRSLMRQQIVDQMRELTP